MQVVGSILLRYPLHLDTDVWVEHYHDKQLEQCVCQLRCGYRVDHVSRAISQVWKLRTTMGYVILLRERD
jgi:hypothetical protein